MDEASNTAPLVAQRFGGTDYRPLVQRCGTAYDIFRLLRSISTSFGYSHFLIIDLPASGMSSLSAVSVISNWPPELVNAYDAYKLMEDSPIFEGLLQSTNPIIWEIGQTSGRRTAERQTLSDSLFEEFGLISGVDFSVHTAKGSRGVVSFAGNRPVPCAWELMELSFLSALVYERLKSFSPSKSTVDTILSRREQECLQWTAAGKTSQEIAVILGLSEHTVNHYLSTVCQKIDAHNRAHMVSKAMRMGLLH